MEYISSDTNIWLDFNAISKIELPFRMPYTYIMYRETLRKEVISPSELLFNLKRLGLKGVEITTEEFYYAYEIQKEYIRLSGYDRIALSIAKHRNITLLTGDNALRKAAQKENVNIFGTIGLLDRLYKGGLVSESEYKFCIESFLKHEERRLPVEELKKRLGLIKTIK